MSDEWILDIAAASDWSPESINSVVDQSGKTVVLSGFALNNSDEAQDRTRELVKRWNSHARLIEALEKATFKLLSDAYDLRTAEEFEAGRWAWPDGFPTDVHKTIYEAVETLRAQAREPGQ